MRIEAEFSSFYLPLWIRTVANLLDSETNDIVVPFTSSGTYVYFEINDPAEDARADSRIRPLSGNDKMLYLYQMWLGSDSKIESFPWTIVSFRLYSETSDKEVRVLFENNEPINYYFPPKPDPFYSNVIDPGFYYDATTLAISVNVDSAPALTFSILCIVISLLITVF